jgi:hypothetical protein
MEVQMDKKSIKLRKIVSFQTMEWGPSTRLHVLATCQRKKLVWLRCANKEEEQIELYDPFGGRLETRERKLPEHIRSIVIGNDSAQLLPTVWLDEENWRWIHFHTYYRDRNTPNEKECLQLDLWSHEGAKLLARIPLSNDVRGRVRFSCDTIATRCAAFAGNTTYVVDLKQRQIAAKWTEKEEAEELTGGLMTPDGDTVFRFLWSRGRVTIKAYKLVSCQ